MEHEYQLDVGELLKVAKKKWLSLLLSTLALAAVAVLAAVMLPAVYESKGTILIESQQISEDFISSSANQFANERIEVIKQRVLTRENLLKIIEKHNLFADEKKSLTSSELIDLIRQNILINLLSADTGKRSKVTIAFEVIYEDSRPDLAHKVANELVTLFLDENVKARTASAAQTTEFLAEQAEILRKALEEIEDKVSAYKQQHANALPENQELYMATLQRLDSSVKEFDRDYKATQDEIRFLEVELAGAKAGVGFNQVTNAPVVTAETELDRLHAEYARLQATYKESHPTLRNLKAKIESLEKIQPKPTDKPLEQEKPVQKMSEKDLLVEKLQVRLEATRNKLESIAKQKAEAQAKMSQLESQIGQTPEVQRELIILMRDYENAKRKYEEVKSKQLSAKISENLEQDNKAERFTLIEPPVQPDKPIRPDRVKIVSGGLAAALLLPIGLVLGLEIVASKVRGVEGVTALMGAMPLVSIPYMQNYEEIAKQRKRLRQIAFALLAMVVLGALLIHFLYMPLNMLYYKLTVIF